MPFVLGGLLPAQLLTQRPGGNLPIIPTRPTQSRQGHGWLSKAQTERRGKELGPQGGFQLRFELRFETAHGACPTHGQVPHLIRQLPAPYGRFIEDLLAGDAVLIFQVFPPPAFQVRNGLPQRLRETARRQELRELGDPTAPQACRLVVEFLGNLPLQRRRLFLGLCGAYFLLA